MSAVRTDAVAADDNRAPADAAAATGGPAATAADADRRRDPADATEMRDADPPDARFRVVQDAERQDGSDYPSAPAAELSTAADGRGGAAAAAPAAPVPFGDPRRAGGSSAERYVPSAAEPRAAAARQESLRQRPASPRRAFPFRQRVPAVHPTQPAQVPVLR